MLTVSINRAFPFYFRLLREEGGYCSLTLTACCGSAKLAFPREACSKAGPMGWKLHGYHTLSGTVTWRLSIRARAPRNDLGAQSTSATRGTSVRRPHSRGRLLPQSSTLRRKGSDGRGIPQTLHRTHIPKAFSGASCYYSIQRVTYFTYTVLFPARVSKVRIMTVTESGNGLHMFPF